MGGVGLWPYLIGHPDEAQIFGQATTGKAAANTAAVLGAYDFGRFDTVADIEADAGIFFAPCWTLRRRRKRSCSTFRASFRRWTQNATG